MPNADAAPSSASGITVPASRLQEFEPTELGALRPRYRRLLAKLDGQAQSAIRRLLIQEAADVERLSERRERGEGRRAWPPQAAAIHRATEVRVRGLQAGSVRGSRLWTSRTRGSRACASGVDETRRRLLGNSVSGVLAAPPGLAAAPSRELPRPL
jgi:hypothetical protein